VEIMKLLSHKSSLVEKKYAGKVDFETSPDSNQGYSELFRYSTIALKGVCSAERAPAWTFPFGFHESR